MHIVVNGESIEVIEGLTVAGLLTRLNVGRERVAVEVNLDIVPKATYETHALSLAIVLKSYSSSEAGSTPELGPEGGSKPTTGCTHASKSTRGA